MDGRTQLVGLIGWPVEHSFSPRMHNAAFDALGLNWRYVPLPVRPGRVEDALRGLMALGFRGANVTVPHKRAVLAALDDVAPDARALGAVNTLVVAREDDRGPALHGHNTDAGGFVAALRRGGFTPQGARAVVVGAGGAARAVVFGLLEAGARRVVVLNRTPARARRLVADLGAGDRLDAHPLTGEALVEHARAADLLVNATTVGMAPAAERTIWVVDAPLPASLTVFDLVYNPLETRLLRQARRVGAATIDGLGMLVHQGAQAFELWTGRPAPVAVMARAARESLSDP
jgi:shikimate dehydrogenase